MAKFKCKFSLSMDDDMQAEFVVTEEQYKILEQLEEQLLNQCSCVNVNLQKIDNDSSIDQKANYISIIYSELLNISYKYGDYYVIDLKDGYTAGIYYNPHLHEFRIISIENGDLELSNHDLKYIEEEIIGML